MSFTVECGGKAVAGQSAIWPHKHLTINELSSEWAQGAKWNVEGMDYRTNNGASCGRDREGVLTWLIYV